MKKIFISYLTISLFSIINAANYYVDKDAVGLNNGTSWVNAWQTTNQIDWVTFQVNDTLFISGGVYPQWTISAKTGSNGYRYIIGSYEPGHNDEVIFRNTSNSTPTIFFGWDANSNIWMENITVESPTGTIDNMSAVKVAYGDSIIFNKIYVHTCLASNRISHGFNLAWTTNIEVNNSTIISDSNTVSREQDGIIVGNATDGYFKFDNNKIILAGWTTTEYPHRDGVQFWSDKPSAANTNVIFSNNFIYDKVNTTKRSMAGLYTCGVAGNFNIFNNIIKLKGYGYTSAISIQAGSYTNQNLNANIYNNTILIDYQQYPLEAVGCDTVRARNNIVMRTSNTFYLAWELSNCNYKDINYNQYYAPVGNNNSFRVNESEKSFLYWQSTLGYDINGEWNAATFININGTEEADYSLLPTSYGIDEGTSISLFNDDISGISRPQGGSWDRGAFEMSSSNPDLTAPELLSAEVVDSVTVILIFSEALESSSAQNKSNYSINNGTVVNSALLSADGKNATLSTSLHQISNIYTVTVSNVVDLSGNLISTQNNSYQYEYNILNSGLLNLPVYNAIADNWYQNYTPDRTIDGLTTGDSRWGGARSMPDTILYSLGDVQILNYSKISFYEWNHGRIYQYTLQVSTDSINWQSIMENIPSSNQEWSVESINPIEAKYVRVISLSNNQSAYAGIYETEFWGYLKIATNIQKDNITPASFQLEQNYPNPFNPSTKIRYTIPNTGIGPQPVQLVIYDILGNEVSTLVSEEKMPGNYEVEFKSENLASGVYVYRIQTSDPSTSSGQVFSEAKKMMLLR